MNKINFLRITVILNFLVFVFTCCLNLNETSNALITILVAAFVGLYAFNHWQLINCTEEEVQKMLFVDKLKKIGLDINED